MANEQGTAQIDSLNPRFRLACSNCVANASVHVRLLGKSGNEGETPARHVQSFMQGVLLRVAFLGIGAQNGW